MSITHCKNKNFIIQNFVKLSYLDGTLSASPFVSSLIDKIHSNPIKEQKHVVPETMAQTPCIWLCSDTYVSNTLNFSIDHPEPWLVDHYQGTYDPKLDSETADRVHFYELHQNKDYAETEIDLFRLNYDGYKTLSSHELQDLGIKRAEWIIGSLGNYDGIVTEKKEILRTSDFLRLDYEVIASSESVPDTRYRVAENF